MYRYIQRFYQRWLYNRIYRRKIKLWLLWAVRAAEKKTLPTFWVWLFQLFVGKLKLLKQYFSICTADKDIKNLWKVFYFGLEWATLAITLF